MKIVIVCQKFGNEGLANYLFNIAIRLKEEGHEVLITTTYSSTWKEIVYRSPIKTRYKEKRNNIPIFNLGFSLIKRIKIILSFPYLAVLKKSNYEKYNFIIQKYISEGFKNSIQNISKDADYIYGIAAIRPHFLRAIQKYSEKPFYL